MDTNYGLLLNSDAKLHRLYFDEMVRLLGITVKYYAPKDSKSYDTWGRIDSSYDEPFTVGCIFDGHPTVNTLKKLGWVSELTEKAYIIHVPYDLKNIQVGALFEIPSGIDNTPDRMFKVSKMSTTMIYPASVACEIVPEYKNTTERAEIEQFNYTDFNLLNGEDR